MSCRGAYPKLKLGPEMLYSANKMFPSKITYFTQKVCQQNLSYPAGGCGGGDLHLSAGKMTNAWWQEGEGMFGRD